MSKQQQAAVKEARRITGKVSHTRQMRAEIAANDAEVMYLTGINADALERLKSCLAIEWLCMYCQLNWADACTLLADARVWNWWENEWCRRDTHHKPILYAYEERKGRLWVYRTRQQQIFNQRSPDWKFLEAGYKNIRL